MGHPCPDCRPSGEKPDIRFGVMRTSTTESKRMPDSFHDMLVAELPRLRVAAIALSHNRAVAEDLVQDAVTKALAARQSFELGTNFSAWMRTILHNTFISTVRRKREVLADDVAVAVDQRISIAASAEENIAVKELSRCMAKLPAVQRHALVAIVLHGMSYEELAKATNVAVGTAKCRVFRARRTLEAMLLGEQPVPAAAPEPPAQRAPRRRRGPAEADALAGDASFDR